MCIKGLLIISIIYQMIIAVIINRFVGCLSRIDAENMLKDLQDGVFLIRESDQRRGEYAVGLR